MTHDLDFTTVMALTGAVRPSVIQLRVQDILPQAAGALVVRALALCAGDLERGAIVTIDETAMRVRILPFEPAPPSS